MKHISKITGAVSGVLALMCAWSCDNALNPVLDNAFYISEAASSNVSKKILNEVDGCEVTATVRCGARLEKDVQVTLALSGEALEEYNRRNGTSLQMLPGTQHDFSDRVLTVKAGQSLSEIVSIHVKPHTAQMMESGIKYALPLSIVEVSDGTPVLEVKKTMIYTFEQVIITSGFQINAMSGAAKVLKNKVASSQYTVELRVAPRGLNKENEAFLMIYPDQDPVDEGYGQVYCRFQKDNTLNIKVFGNENYTWPGPLTTKWYHIALVSTGDGNLITYINGVEVMRENKPSYAGVNHLEKITLGSSSSTWHTNSYCYSEVRLWSVVRTPSQIADNMYAVNPSSEGLEVYWKCNEGEGTVLHDATGNGNDIDLTADIETSASAGFVTWQWMGPVRTDTDEIFDN